MKQSLLICFCWVAPLLLRAQSPAFVANYDDAQVGTYTLPDALLRADGSRVKSAKEWVGHRRYWLGKFAENVYGVTPDQRVRVRYETVSVKSVLEGKATRKIVKIHWTDYPQLRPLEVLLYLPNASRPAPVAMGLNFMGNASTTTEGDVPLSDNWARNTDNGSVVNHRFTEKSRGVQADRWHIKALIDNGIALATAYYGDLEPDHAEGWRIGIRSVLGDTTKTNNWGAIGAWAWGLSRMMDYLETETQINIRQSFLTGHSRLGKAALWAAAQDERFALVNANDSGEGGAALSRRNFGETIKRLNDSFPHWFCQNYRQYNDNAAKMPTDQHILLSLVAPRPLYVASASEDLWADPKGEFLSLKAAESVYQLFDISGLKETTHPPVNQPIGNKLRYHLRQGKHDITPYDWQQYVDFMKANWN
jgi:hypothetical protein